MNGRATTLRPFLTPAPLSRLLGGINRYPPIEGTRVLEIIDSHSIVLVVLHSVYIYGNTTFPLTKNALNSRWGGPDGSTGGENSRRVPQEGVVAFIRAQQDGAFGRVSVLDATEAVERQEKQHHTSMNTACVCENDDFLKRS